MQQSAEMVVGTKNEETFLLFVPVGPHAAEYGCAIQKAMSGYVYFCFGKWNNFSLKECMLREIHKGTSGKGDGDQLLRADYNRFTPIQIRAPQENWAAIAVRHHWLDNLGIVGKIYFDTCRISFTDIYKMDDKPNVLDFVKAVSDADRLRIIGCSRSMQGPQRRLPPS
jgi:hypothetical protein